MSVNLYGRSFLKLLDFTPDEIRFLLGLAASLKAAKYGGYEEQRDRGAQDQEQEVPADRRHRTAVYSMRALPAQARTAEKGTHTISRDASRFARG